MICAEKRSPKVLCSLLDQLRDSSEVLPLRNPIVFSLALGGLVNTAVLELKLTIHLILTRTIIHSVDHSPAHTHILILPGTSPTMTMNLPALLLTLLLARGAANYSLTVRDSIMIAHSFANNPSFGPAQNLHGATYTVDVTFKAKKLHKENNWVVDIGDASEVLAEVCGRLTFRNLDEVYPGEMTTTEFMCKVRKHTKRGTWQ